MYEKNKITCDNSWRTRVANLGLTQKLIHIFHGADGVVLFRTLGVILQVNLFHLLVTDTNAFFVLPGMKDCSDSETGCGFCGPDELQHGFIIGQRLGRPVVGEVSPTLC